MTFPDPSIGDARSPGRRTLRAGLTVALFTICVLRFASPSALAAPTQEEVFKSIENNVNEPSSGSGAMPFLLAGAAVVILLALFTQHRNRSLSPRPANHQGKLLREVLRTVPLRSAEIKQLRLLAEASRDESGPVSPLTLVLCPSVLNKMLRKPPAKADRKVLAQLAKKTGAAGSLQ